MKKIGAVLAVLGILIFLGGLAVDTTKTMTTCYEADYSWDQADSSGCIETTVPNYGPKIATSVMGVFMIIGGIGLFIHQSQSESSSTTNSTNMGPTGRENQSDPSSKSFADKLEEKQK